MKDLKRIGQPRLVLVAGRDVAQPRPACVLAAQVTPVDVRTVKAGDTLTLRDTVWEGDYPDEDLTLFTPARHYVVMEMLAQWPCVVVLDDSGTLNYINQHALSAFVHWPGDSAGAPA